MLDAHLINKIMNKSATGFKSYVFLLNDNAKVNIFYAINNKQPTCYSGNGRAVGAYA